jgi:MoaA/NifB/PqqE/SkfB family radical SAM enzyme
VLDYLESRPFFDYINKDNDLSIKIHSIVDFDHRKTGNVLRSTFSHIRETMELIYQIKTHIDGNGHEKNIATLFWERELDSIGVFHYLMMKMANIDKPNINPYIIFGRTLMLNRTEPIPVHDEQKSIGMFDDQNIIIEKLLQESQHAKKYIPLLESILNEDVNYKQIREDGEKYSSSYEITNPKNIKDKKIHYIVGLIMKIKNDRGLKMFNDIDSLVSGYYLKRGFFCVPNICNARCKFCYFKPQKASEVETIDATFLIDAKKVMKRLKELGFTEFRFTGGEPLLFQNFTELLNLVKENHLSYTILTNGILLSNYFDYFQTNKPKKITISYHSKEKYKEIFGIDDNSDLIDSNIRELIRMKIQLTITIVLLNENYEEINNHIDHLISLGVTSIKLIYPNDIAIKGDMKEKFSQLIDKLNSPNISLKYSNCDNSRCELYNKGYLSYFLQKKSLSACSNIVPKHQESINIEDIEKKLWDFYLDYKDKIKIPCKSHINSCPLSCNSL